MVDFYQKMQYFYLYNTFSFIYNHEYNTFSFIYNHEKLRQAVAVYNLFALFFDIF